MLSNTSGTKVYRGGTLERAAEQAVEVIKYRLCHVLVLNDILPLDLERVDVTFTPLVARLQVEKTHVGIPSAKNSILERCLAIVLARDARPRHLHFISLRSVIFSGDKGRCSCAQSRRRINSRATAS